jgi:DoxX-like family
MEKELTIKEVRISQKRLFVYWITTAIVALQVAAGAYFDLTGSPAFSQIAQHLGYPIYLLTILGVLRILALIALLAPRFPRLKEWTYAGLFFEYTVALTSHIVIGDGANVWIMPLIFASILIASWYLRPPSRCLQNNIAA